MPKGFPKNGINKGSFKKGHVMSGEVRQKISNKLKGKIVSVETRKKLSAFQKGEKAYWWKGGISNKDKIIRLSLEYKLWRESVFKRDDFTCVWCLKKGGTLNADHIKPFAHYPELRFAIDNGRTLCVECHRTTDTYGGKSRTKICKTKI